MRADPIQHGMATLENGQYHAKCIQPAHPIGQPSEKTRPETFPNAPTTRPIVAIVALEIP